MRERERIKKLHIIIAPRHRLFSSSIFIFTKTDFSLLSQSIDFLCFNIPDCSATLQVCEWERRPACEREREAVPQKWDSLMGEDTGVSAMANARKRSEWLSIAMCSHARDRDDTILVSLLRSKCDPQQQSNSNISRERVDDKSENRIWWRIECWHVQQVLIEASERTKTIEFINNDNGKNKTHFDLFNP